MPVWDSIRKFLLLGMSTLLEKLKQFLDGTKTYRSLKAGLVITASLVSLGAIKELLQFF